MKFCRLSSLLTTVTIMKISKFFAIMLASCVTMAQADELVINDSTAAPIVITPEFDTIDVQSSCEIDSFDVAVSGARMDIGSGIEVTVSNIIINDGPVTLNNSGTLKVEKLTIVVDDAIISQGGKYVFTVFEGSLVELWDVTMNPGIECFVTKNGEYITPVSSNIEIELGGDVDLGFGMGAGNVSYVVEAEFASTVPEPSTAVLSMLAVCGLVTRRRRK